MRAPRAQHRRPGGEGRRLEIRDWSYFLVTPLRLFEAPLPRGARQVAAGRAKELFQAFRCQVCGEFSRVGYGACQFSVDFHRDLVFSGGIGDGLLQYRIQFFHRQHFRQSFQEPERQLFREGIGRGHLKDLDILPVSQDLFHVFISHAAADDALLSGTGNGIEPVAIQVLAHLHQFFLQGDVVLIGKPRENDPLRILFKAFRLFCIDLSVDLHGLVPVTDPRGGP